MDSMDLSEDSIHEVGGAVRGGVARGGGGVEHWTCLYIERVGSTTAVRTLNLQRSEPRL